MVTQDQNATPDSYQVGSYEIPGAENGCELSNMDKAIPNAEATSELNGKYQLGTSCIPKALASGEATGSSCGFQVGNLEIPVAEVDRFQKLRDNHGVFQLGTQDADDQQAKKAPTVQHFLWWMAAGIGTGVAL